MDFSKTNDISNFRLPARNHVNNMVDHDIDDTSIDSQNVKNEPSHGYVLDFVSINSSNRITFKEEKENLLENQNLNGIMRISRNFKETTKNILNNGVISERLDIKQEPLEQDNFESDLVSLSSNNRIIYKEDTEELYKDHVIKEELVLGPEIIQRANKKKPLSERIIFAEDTILTSENSRKKAFECNSCCRVFEFKKGLIKHKRVCAAMFTCDYCGNTFNTRDQISCHIKRHMKRFVKKDKAIITKTMTKKINHSSKSNNATFNKICKICGRKFVFKESLMRHMQLHNSHENIDNSSYRCDVCGKIYSYQNNLHRHIKAVHAGIKPHKCKECDKTYIHKSDFLVHCQQSHKIPTAYTQKKQMMACQFCNKLFTDKPNCNRHMKYYCKLNKNKSKFIPKEKFPCNVCEKTYIRKDSLTHHMKKHLGNRVTYKCDFCSKDFTKKHYLRYHIHSKHMKIKNATVHPCDKCKKSFVSPWHLNLHKKAHCKTILNSLYCNTCPRTFKRSDNFERHTKFHLELNTTKYQCDLCDKVYEVKNKITSHMQLEHGFKKISCPKCKQTFRHYSGLAIHKKICGVTAPSQ